MSTVNFPDQAGRRIVITRVIDAPRRLVFDAFTKPEHLVHWHNAGEGWTTPFAESDPRPGGALRTGYGSPDGKDDFALELTLETEYPEDLQRGGWSAHLDNLAAYLPTTR